MGMFKKILFWFLVVISVIIGFGIIGTISGENADKETGLIMAIIVFIPWAIYLIVKLVKRESPKAKERAEKYQIQKEEERKEFEAKYKGFKLIAEYQKYLLYVNEENKQFALKDDFYNFKDLISAEIVADDDVITTTHTQKKASVGKALVGGALFGGAGAIIGGNAGKSKSTSTNKKVCDKLQIKLTLNSIEKPIIYIDFIKGRTNKSSFLKTYQKAYDSAEHFLGIFQVMINNK